jgi:DNA processing protein
VAALAVVGARRCTEYGERTARRIAREAAALGIVVVSGLARGVDAAAHRGALETGRTAAVLAGGLDRVYPGEHRSLADRVVEQGGFLLSEQPPGSRPLPWLFPFRNRIITGLCLATVVVEASQRSGSLASARHALDQGRDVFAVPGPIDSPSSEGSNGLLAQGAAPFCRTGDLRSVNGFSKAVEKSSRNNIENIEYSLTLLEPDQAAILVAIRAGVATPDEICATTALDGTRVLTLLTALELDGLIRREAHGRFRAIATGR